MTETDTAERFWLGEQHVLEDRHIGQVIYLDHYARHDYSRVTGTSSWDETTHVGTLEGFDEHRGKAILGLADGRPDEFGSFPDYEVTVYFRGGRSVRIKEADRAYVTINR